jgi:transcriptional regulator with XRE-family HTH domain
MSKRKINLMSDTQQVLVKMGANIRKARLRRNLNAEYIAELANISTDTLSSIEKGVSTVSIGAYVAVLAVLELDKDILLIALDEEGKKQFREQNLYPRKRASKKK